MEAKELEAETWLTSTKAKKWRITLFTILITIAMPIVIIASIPVLIIRKFCQILVKTMYWDAKNVDKILHPVSQIFVHDYLKPNPRLNIQVCFFGDGHDSVETMRELVRRNIVERKLGPPNSGSKSQKYEYPELKRKTVFIGGFHYWKYIRDFDMKDYVRKFEYDEKDPEFLENKPKKDNKGNIITTEEDLKKILAYLAAKSWNKDKSPWEFLIINNYVDEPNQKKKKTIAIFRTHHYMADGYSILNMMIRMSAENYKYNAEPDSNFKRKINEGFKKNRPLLGMLLIPLLLPYQIALMADEFFQRDRNKWRIAPEKKDKRAQKYYQNWSSEIQVETIKTIKNKFGISFQAVLNSIVSCAIQCLMRSMNQEVPKDVSSVIPIPLPGHPGGLSNHFGYVIVRLPVGELDPVKRLQLATQELQNSAKSTLPFMIYIVYHFFGMYPTIATRWMSTLTVGNTLVFSPFPGVDGLHYWGNCKGTNVLYTIGTGTGDAGATVTTLTCFEKIRISLVIDHEVFPSEETLRKFDKFVKQEIETLLSVGRLE